MNMKNINLDSLESDYLFTKLENELTIESLLDTIIFEREKARLEHEIDKALLENNKHAFLTHSKALNSLEKPACLYFIVKR